VSVKPDTDTTPVASCTGQPDMKLCRVVTDPDRDYDICVGGVCVSPGCGDTSCNAPAPHFIIPPNSQHTYFERQASAEPVVIDLVTGLHWQACAAGDTGDACDGGAQLKLTWNEAVAYCDSSTWAEHDDWYLPDVWEMFSIWDYTMHGTQGAGLDATLFPDGAPFPWTSALSGAQEAFAVQITPAGQILGGLAVLGDGVTSKRTARCVRRGFSRDAGYVQDRFVRSSGATQPVVEDKATNLVWQGCTSGATGQVCTGTRTKVAIADFVSHCEDLTWADQSDWRLPTYEELHSIVQYPPLVTGEDPRISPEFFDVGSLSSDYLAARTGLGADARMLLLNVRTGNPVQPTGEYHVLCVRWK
jgi:hypothetical protein